MPVDEKSARSVRQIAEQVGGARYRIEHHMGERGRFQNELVKWRSEPRIPRRKGLLEAGTRQIFEDFSLFWTNNTCNFLDSGFNHASSALRRASNFQVPSVREVVGMAKKEAAKKAKSPTKTEVFSSIAAATGLTKKQVAAVFDALAGEIRKALSNRGPGIFTIPGLVKIDKRKIPARPAQKGVRNPFTGEIRDIPAKPASVKVRVRALKNLKSMIS